MIWTVTIHADGSIRSIHPGVVNKFPGSSRIQIEAPNFKQAEQVANEKLQQRVLNKPAIPHKPYRHPAFEKQPPRKPRGRKSETLAHKSEPLVCECGAVLGPKELNCSVCRWRIEQALNNHNSKVLDEPRIMKPNEAHLRILLEVRETWMKSPNVAMFAKWLNEEIGRVENSKFPVSDHLPPASV